MARGVVRIAIANQRNESRLDCTRSRLKPSVHDFEKRERYLDSNACEFGNHGRKKIFSFNRQKCNSLNEKDLRKGAMKIRRYRYGELKQAARYNYWSSGNCIKRFV